MSMKQFNEWLRSGNNKDVSLLATMCRLLTSPIDKLIDSGPDPVPLGVWDGWK